MTKRNVLKMLEIMGELEGSGTVTGNAVVHVKKTIRNLNIIIDKGFTEDRVNNLGTELDRLVDSGIKHRLIDLAYDENSIIVKGFYSYEE